MAFNGLHHVVIRVKDIDEAIASYEKLGMELTRQLETPGIGKQAIFSFGDGTFIELVAPLSPDDAVGRAIESRGEGVHTVALEVPDFDGTVAAITEGGARVIRMEGMDTTAFVHPKSTHGVLLQVQQEK